MRQTNEITLNQHTPVLLIGSEAGFDEVFSIIGDLGCTSVTSRRKLHLGKAKKVI